MPKRKDQGLDQFPAAAAMGRQAFGVFWFSLVMALSLTAEDWPLYRGPTADGLSGERILKQWPEGGPRTVWKTALASGFSSFTIRQGQAYTLVRRSVSGVNQEVCIALNADTGAEVWARPLGQVIYDSGGSDGTPTNRGGDGPRSTPSVQGDRVYVLSGNLQVFCLNALNGQVVWSRDLVSVYGGQVISWQNAASPLIEGDLVLVNCNAPSQCLLALRATNGSLAWKGANDRMTHATPVPATILGTRQVVFLAQSGLVAVAPDTGKVLWRYSFPYSTSTGASPVVAGDIVYCSAGYNVGAAAVRLSKSGTTFTVRELWRKPNALMNQWSTPVHYSGYLYGLYGHGEYGTAPLKCVRLSSGQELWSEEGFGPGGVVLVDGLVLVLSDTGELVLVRPDPSAYSEVARYKAITGKCWNVPAISNGRIYVRSTKEGACLDVALAPPAPLRLENPTRQANGRIECQLYSTDGGPLAVDRFSRIAVHSSPSLLEPRANWTPLAECEVLTNGVVRLGPFSSPGPLYFIVVEQP